MMTNKEYMTRKLVVQYENAMKKMKMVNDIIDILKASDKPLFAKEICYKLAEIGYGLYYSENRHAPISVGLFIRNNIKGIKKEDVPCDYTIKVECFLGYEQNKNGSYTAIYGEKEITPKQRVYSIK